jgi:hypothetical protein
LGRRRKVIYKVEECSELIPCPWCGDISELYSTEIEKASDEKAMLWMFENVMDV